MFGKNPEIIKMLFELRLRLGPSPRVLLRDGESLVRGELGLQEQFVEEMDQGDGVLLGGEYRDHQVRWEPSSSQGLLQDGLGNERTVRGGPW